MAPLISVAVLLVLLSKPFFFGTANSLQNSVFSLELVLLNWGLAAREQHVNWWAMWPLVMFTGCVFGALRNVEIIAQCGHSHIPCDTISCAAC